MAYEEQLLLPWWWWLGGLRLTASIGAAVFAYLPWQVSAVVTGLVAIAVAAVLVGYGSSKLIVNDGWLQAGRNRIETRWIESAEGFEGQAAAAAAGPQASRHDFLHTRPYVSGLVRVHLDDPADPHPHWLISTRRPEALAQAINDAVGEGA